MLATSYLHCRKNDYLTLACCAQVSQMQHGLSVVADLTGGDAEMQRAVQETIKAFGGLDIIVNR